MLIRMILDEQNNDVVLNRLTSIINNEKVLASVDMASAIRDMNFIPVKDDVISFRVDRDNPFSIAKVVKLISTGAVVGDISLCCYGVDYNGVIDAPRVIIQGNGNCEIEESGELITPTLLILDNEIAKMIMNDDIDDTVETLGYQPLIGHPDMYMNKINVLIMGTYYYLESTGYNISKSLELINTLYTELNMDSPMTLTDNISNIISHYDDRNIGESVIFVTLRNDNNDFDKMYSIIEKRVGEVRVIVDNMIRIDNVTLCDNNFNLREYSGRFNPYDIASFILFGDDFEKYPDAFLGVGILDINVDSGSIISSVHKERDSVNQLYSALINSDRDCKCAILYDLYGCTMLGGKTMQYLEEIYGTDKLDKLGWVSKTYDGISHRSNPKYLIDTALLRMGGWSQLTHTGTMHDIASVYDIIVTSLTEYNRI